MAVPQWRRLILDEAQTCRLCQNPLPKLSLCWYDSANDKDRPVNDDPFTYNPRPFECLPCGQERVRAEKARAEEWRRPRQQAVL